MAKITAYTSYDERTNTRYSRDFEIVSGLPKVNDTFTDAELTVTVKSVFPVALDCEQGSDEVWSYDFYCVECDAVNDEGEAFDYDVKYICIRRAEAKIYTADRETGTFIEEVKSIEEALELIKKYEEQDKADGTFTEDFYDVVDESHISLI